MPSNEYDFLIVGQGLAGSLIAFELINRDQRVMVIDNHHVDSSTQVAAGLINPITGHRLNITERFNLYNEAARKFYHQAEEQLGKQFYREVDQVRRINNAGQADYCAKRLEQDEYENLLARTTNSDFLQSEFGCISVKQTAVVDSKLLLNSYREWLKSKAAYAARKFDYASLETRGSRFCYGAINAKRVIFCEGYQAIHNPWLKDLPFKLAKGEILTIETEQHSTKMLSWGNWLVPSRANFAKLGSNFAWNDLSLSPSDEIKNKLLSSLRDNTNIQGQVKSHEVGIRPTTTQRKPFVGELTKLANSYCLNGLGSKGCLIAPYYCGLLADHLLKGSRLPTEVTQWL